MHTVYENERRKMNYKDSNHSPLSHRLAGVFVIREAVTFLSRSFIMTVYTKATQRLIFIITYNKPVLYMLYGPSFAKKPNLICQKSDRSVAM